MFSGFFSFSQPVKNTAPARKTIAMSGRKNLTFIL